MNTAAVESNPEKGHPTEFIAAIDLGTNSFHMVIAKHHNKALSIIDRDKEKIQLGRGLTKDNRLTEAAISKALNCLSRFNERLKAHQVTRVKVVGTNTLRVAKNRMEFLAQARQIFNYPIDIIAGKEEARLIYTGVRKSGAAKDRTLVIDIGGGSTEIVIGHKRDIKALDSMHMGCVTFQTRYFKGDEISAENFDKAETAAALELLPIIEQYKSHHWDQAVGCSGTIQSILSIVVSQNSLVSKISLNDLLALKEYLVKTKHVNNIELEGLIDDRKGILPAGLAILIALLKGLGIKELGVSDSALREGLLYEMIDAKTNSSIRETTINRMLKLCHVDIKHAKRVEVTALDCLKQVEEAWDLKDEEHKQLLTLASLVHEIGLVISFNQVHKHSAYILNNADLHGFTQHQKMLLAAVVRGFRRKFPALHFESIPLENRLACKRLCRLLRLAVIINHQRSEHKITGFQLQADHHGLALTLPKSVTEDYPLLLADLAVEERYMDMAGYELNVTVD